VRVVFLTHNYPRIAGDIAGGFLHPLAVALNRRGVDVRVIAPSDAGKGGRDVLDGIPVERVRYDDPERETLAYTGRMQDALQSPGGVVTFYRLWKSLRRAAAEATARGNDSVIHAHWWIPAGLAVPPGRRFVLTSHGTDVRLLERWALARWLARPVYHRAAVVTAVSSHLAEHIGRFTGRNVPPDRVQPMPVDTSHWGFSDGGGGLIAVARLTEQKRLHLLIAAIATLKGRGIALRCTIVGDGPARVSLEQQARREGVDQLVEFAGQLPFPDVLARLQHADVAVLPARAEGFGLSAAEALMAGVPIVVCRDGGGLLDLAEPGASRVAEPEPMALADAIGDLLASGGAREAARQAGLRWRERLSPDAVASRFESWYAEAARA
jgi:glycosyltransferase involved in cell wall biosynthesis